MVSYKPNLNTKAMKKLSLLFILALFISAYNASAKTCCAITISSTAKQMEERTTGSFKGIASGSSLKIKVTIGNKESIRFEGDADAIADLITEVKDGILIIRPKTKWNDWSRRYRNADITAYISAKRLTSLTMSGSGSLDVLNPINGSDLVTTLTGSGSITATANVRSLTGVISGSGSLELKGKSDNSNLTLSGSGQFKGKNFSVNDLSVQISGSANVYIAANEKIEAVISGSGNVYYSGDPTVKKTTIGSGRVRKM